MCAIANWQNVMCAITKNERWQKHWKSYDARKNPKGTWLRRYAEVAQTLWHTWALCFSTWLTSKALLFVVLVELDVGDLAPCSIPWRITEAPKNLLSNARASMSSLVSPLSTTTNVFTIKIQPCVLPSDTNNDRGPIYLNRRSAFWSKRLVHRSLVSCYRGTKWDRYFSTHLSW